MEREDTALRIIIKCLAGGSCQEDHTAVTSITPQAIVDRTKTGHRLRAVLLTQCPASRSSAIPNCCIRNQGRLHRRGRT